MDPDSGGDFSSSVIFKTTVLTVAFTSIYFFETKRSFTVFKPTTAKADTVVLKTFIPKKRKRRKKPFTSLLMMAPTKAQKM